MALCPAWLGVVRAWRRGEWAAVSITYFERRCTQLREAEDDDAAAPEALRVRGAMAECTKKTVTKKPATSMPGGECETSGERVSGRCQGCRSVNLPHGGRMPSQARCPGPPSSTDR